MKKTTIVLILLFFIAGCFLSSCPPANSGPAGNGPAIGVCAVFPANNIWNTPADTMPVDPNSNAYIRAIGPATSLHPDFGTEWQGAPIGIPYVLVNNSQPSVTITYTDYGSESDPGPFPIPPDAPIEGGPQSDGDRHVIVINTDTCMLYELFYSWPLEDNSWEASSGAMYDLSSNALRPDGYTSADAAGLPIFPGLVRYDEVEAGEIKHAIRFTLQHTRNTHVWPARHHASSLSGTQYPPMGQRFRLKSDFDISGFSTANQVILRALKTYGMILADNGSDMYISGAHDDRWDDDDLHHLQDVPASAFEAVDVSSLVVDPDSGRVNE